MMAKLDAGKTRHKHREQLISRKNIGRCANLDARCITVSLTVGYTPTFFSLAAVRPLAFISSSLEQSTQRLHPLTSRSAL
jgi:hypothetical protein